MQDRQAPAFPVVQAQDPLTQAVQAQVRPTQEPMEVQVPMEFKQMFRLVAVVRAILEDLDTGLGAEVLATVIPRSMVEQERGVC